MSPLTRKNVVYPELSYKIVGCAFDVYNDLGCGHYEKYYQKALGVAFLKQGLKFKEEVHTPLLYAGSTIGKNFLDFVVDDKIVVELKRGGKFSKQHFDQVLEYLRISNLKLAILIGFGSEGVMFKRVLNIRKFVPHL